MIWHESKVDMRKVRPLQQQQPHQTSIQKGGCIDPYHAVLEDRETLATSTNKGTSKTLESVDQTRNPREKEKDLGDEGEREDRRKPLTFLAAALKASLCEMSGLTALMRWISSLQSHFPQPRGRAREKKGKGRRQIGASYI